MPVESVTTTGHQLPLVKYPERIYQATVHYRIMVAPVPVDWYEPANMKMLDHFH